MTAGKADSRQRINKIAEEPISRYLNMFSLSPNPFENFNAIKGRGMTIKSENKTASAGRAYIL